MSVVTRIAVTILLMLSCSVAAAESLLYVGTYTGGKSQGIYLLGFDPQTGALRFQGLAAESENPSFLAIHQDGRHVYAVNETSAGELSAFRIDPRTHRLTLLNKQPSGGGAPCHLAIDAQGTSLLVANYSGGSVSSTRIQEDGSLGEQISFIQHQGASVDPRRQREPHAHSINLDSSNRFAVVADLGTDELVIYKFASATGALSRHASTKLTPNAGPRHFAFHPNGRNAYAINELDSTVAALRFDAESGTLSVLESLSTLPEDFAGSSHTAEVRVSHDGRFVYGSNRGHDSIAVFRVGEDGDLTLLQIEPIGGKTPRNFTLDPQGRFLLAAGQSSNDIHVFRIDEQTGKLSKTEHRIDVPKPVCLRFAR